jgi:hypothetical protein
MLYSFSSETSQKSDATTAAGAAQPSLAQGEDKERESAAISAPATTTGGKSTAADPSEFDAYLYHHNTSKASLKQSVEAAHEDEEDPTFFTPTELKMLLLNYENLSAEEQLNLTEYIRRHGGPTEDTTSRVAAPSVVAEPKRDGRMIENSDKAASIFSRYSFVLGQEK